MSEFIPDWAKYYTLEENANGSGINIEFYKHGDSIPAGVTWHYLADLTQHLSSLDVLQQIRENPLENRMFNPEQMEQLGDSVSDTTLRQKIRDTGALDMVNEPPHYKAGDIECIDAIRAALTPEEFRGYCKGNMIKYEWRERLKGGIESIKKAIWYGKQMVEHCKDDK